MDRTILIGEESLYWAISEFVLDYRAEKNHQGLSNKIIRRESSRDLNSPHRHPNVAADSCIGRLGLLIHASPLCLLMFIYSLIRNL